MRRPVDAPYTITTEFGVPDSAAKFGRHAGVDYAVPAGRKIYATVSGIVTDYIWGKYHGNVVQILDDSGRYHRLMHNSKLNVRVGDRVTEGQAVALCGSTGMGTTGSHCHWDISNVKYPTSFGNFLSPATLLFPARVQAPSTPSPARTKTVTLPYHIKSWALYRQGSGLRKNTPDQIATLSPYNIGRDLTYDILGWVGDYAVIIRTTMFGVGVIWTKGTEARIK